MVSAQTIADAFDELATLLEFEGENVFKIRAFRGAALIVRDNAKNLQAFVQDAKEGKISGIGKQLFATLDALYTSGQLAELNDLRARAPAGLRYLLRVPGLGTKKLKTLYSELKIQDLFELEQACIDNRVAVLKGFGEKTQGNILKGVRQIKAYQGFFLYSHALAIAAEIRDLLEASGLCSRIEIVGSLRRRSEVVRNVNMVVVTPKRDALARVLMGHGGIGEVVTQGSSGFEVRVRNGLIVSLKLVSQEEYAAALVYFTGNREHVAALQRLAKTRGLTFEQRGLFRIADPVRVENEEHFYRELGLGLVPPELRENQGEIEVAQGNPGDLKGLIEKAEIKGVLHVHTTWSDGRHTLREMAEATRELGYQYLGVCDHSKSAGYAGGLSIDRVKAQHIEIDELNDELAPFRIFKGIESDILMDGSLDYPDEILRSFDFVIASVHNYITMTSREMTGRLMRAIRNPCTHILGHISGRLLLEREAYEVDISALLKLAAEEGVAIELNANPMRLDLDWRYLKEARDLGIKIPICPDAHSIEGLHDVEFGVGIARKGWLRSSDIPNCLGANELEAFFKKR